MEYYSAIKKEWNYAMCTNVDGLECTMLGEVGQAEGRNVEDSPYMWSVERNATNELTYGAETDSLP